MLKLDAFSWCIYAHFKDGTYQPIRHAVAYRRACDACKEAKEYAKGNKCCGYRRDHIASFVVCKRTDKEVFRCEKGTARAIF